MKRTWIVAVASVGVALGLGMCGCARAPRVLAMPAAPEVFAGNGMEVVWETPLTVPKGRSLKQLWLAGGLVMALDSENRLYAVDARTGVRRWSVRTAPVHETVRRPAVVGDRVWVVSTTLLVGLKAADGREEVRTRLDFAASGAPAAMASHVFIPDARGYLQALAVMPDTVPWRRWMRASVTAGPALDDARVFFASESGEILASSQSRQQAAWTYPAEGAVVADLRVAKGDLVLVASLDYSVYAFRGSSGELRWRHQAGEPVRKPPYTQGDQAFVFTKGRGLAALDISSGQVQWRLAQGEDFAAADEQTVYVVSGGGDLLAVSRADGAVRFGVPLRRGTLAADNETESGIVYLATPEGQVMATAKRKAKEL